MRPDYPKLSPFTAARMQDESIEVQVANQWYELLAIDDVTISSLITFCKQTYSRIWFKRFGEDLVEVLSEMGYPPGGNVSLKLRDIQTNQEVLLEDTPMTEENRRSVWQAAKSQRVEIDWTAHLLPTDLENDLALFRQMLENHYAYLKRTNFDYLAELEQLQHNLQNPTRAEFTTELMKFLAHFRDGHTRLDSRLVARVLPKGYTPFTVMRVNEKYIAIDAGEKKLVDPDFPFVTSIDGVGIETWLQSAKQLGPGGSPQFTHLQSLKNLRFLNYLRQVLGLPDSTSVHLELESEDGTNRRTRALEVTHILPRYGREANTRHQIIESNIGYLKLARMDRDEAFLQGLMNAMDEFRKTNGLIIDVRGNGGGSRIALRTLFPFFMNSRDEPRVANVAAYKRSVDEPFQRPEGYLADRFLYPLNSSHWTSEERATLEQSSLHFSPEWQLPENEFSDWHYFVLSQSKNGGYYHYDSRPVVILMDTSCFSATDIFLGAFKSWHDVTLVGTASGGGSGRPRLVKLPQSEVELNLSSMVSFQANGQLYDGRGITPDIPYEARLSDVLGNTDSAVALALHNI
jgi:Peptidase family S41